MKKVLIVTTVHTHPTNMGNSFAILTQANKLKSLDCDVHILYIQQNAKSAKEIKANTKSIELMQDYWADKLHHYQESASVRMFRNLMYRVSSRFRNCQMGIYQLYPYGVEKMVFDLQRQYHFDICIVNYVFMTKLFDYIKFPQMACFTHDTFAYKNQHTGLNNMWLTAHQEAFALQKCTDVLAIQEEEMNYFKIIAPRCRHYNVYTPYIYESQPVIGNHNIVFLSGRNEFNQNGLRWFIKKVFPLIIQKFPDAKLLIAGGICKVIENEYKNLKGIELLGFVDEPKDFFALGDVAINPTYQGTGLKIKTFESISYDKVTIVHPHSMAGIFDRQNAPLFSSEQPEEWVDILSSVWGNREKIKEIKTNNKKYISEYNRYITNEYLKFLTSS